MEYFVDDSTSSDLAEDLENPALRALFSYWTDKRGVRAWPARSDFDPLDLKPLLGHLALLDVIRTNAADASPRFRYRLFGTAFAEWFGFEMTGRMIDDWPVPEYRAVMTASYREVVSAGRPFRRLRRFIKDGRLLRYEAVMLPLGTGPLVDMVLVAQVFID
ncbi:MAG: PAS domain-containing protein [Ferrovibrio sp.]